MIKQIFGKDTHGRVLGLSDNGELYELKTIEPGLQSGGYRWSHICSSPDDKEKPYFHGVWKKRTGS